MPARLLERDAGGSGGRRSLPPRVAKPGARARRPALPRRTGTRRPLGELAVDTHPASEQHERDPEEEERQPEPPHAPAPDARNRRPDRRPADEPIERAPRPP